MTVVPDVLLGIANAQLKAPVPPVVKEPLVQLVTVTPSNTSPTVLETEKPVPDTVTVAPTGPWAGVTAIAGVVTVNAPVADPPLTSVAATVVPDAPLGTFNVHVKAPVAFVVKEPPAQLVIVTESNTSDANAFDTVKPVPDTVTVAPIGPWVGVLTVIVGVVTANAPVAVWPPTSVAVTVVRDAPLGTSDVQLNAPVVFVVKEPLVQLPIVTPSKTNSTVLDTEKPVPNTVTVAPTGPWVGLTVITSGVTMNVPVTVWPPASVAVTVVPDDPLGTVNVQLNAPVPSIVKEPLVQLAIVIPSKTSDASVVDTEKPVPDTVTVAPTGPWVGLTVIVGVVTVNVLVAACPPTSVAVTVVPDVPLGTSNVHVNAPVPPVVNGPPVQLAIVTPSKTKTTVLVTEKPVPDTVTVARTGPWTGPTVIVGVVTVNAYTVVGLPVAVSNPITE